MIQCNFCKGKIEEKEDEITIKGKKYHNYLIECLAAAAELKDFDEEEFLCEGCKEPIERISPGFFFSRNGKYVHQDEDCLLKYLDKKEIHYELG